MATTLQLRRGTAAEAAAFNGAAGELFIDIENNKAYLHDGSTQGGTEVGISQTEVQDLIDNTLSGDLELSGDLRLGTNQLRLNETGQLYHTGSSKGTLIGTMVNVTTTISSLPEVSTSGYRMNNIGGDLHIDAYRSDGATLFLSAYGRADGEGEVIIQSRGTISIGSMSGTTVVGDVTMDTVTATSFIGDGSQLTGLPRSMSIIAVEKSTDIVDGTDILGAIEIPFDCTITEIRAKTNTGTCTVTFNNEGSVIGAVNATSTGVSNTTLSNTSMSVWDDLTIDISSASGTGLVITIITTEA